MAHVASIRTLLLQLATVTLGLTSSQLAAVAGDLAALPERQLAGAIEDFEGDADLPGDDASDADAVPVGVEDEARPRVLALLALDARPGVRRDVAVSLGVRPLLGPDGEALLAQLALDPDGEVRRVVADDLATQLVALPPIARAEVVARWALDERAERRLALARALATAPVPAAAILGGRSALAMLTRDDDAQVRRVARAALLAQPA